MTHPNAILIVFLFCLLLPGRAEGQGGVTVPSVAPAPLIRLTGVIEAVKTPQRSALPVLSVWIAGKQWLFRLARVEPVIAAYRAQEEMRKVSALGLRFVAGGAVLAALQSAEMHHQPVVIEGWLRVRSGVLQVRSVRVVAE